MNAETQPQPETAEQRAQRLQQQAEQRRNLQERLTRELLTPGRGPATPYTVGQCDELIQEAETLGGIYRPDGNEGLTDPNFVGGRLEAAPGWENILQALRDAKSNYINDPANLARIQADLTVNPGDPDAQRQPLIYLNRRVRRLVEAGYLKPESGRGTQPDGLIIGDRLMATDPTIAADYARMRGAAEVLLRDQLDTQIRARLAGTSTDEEYGQALGDELRDLVVRGLVDLRVPPAPKGKGGAPAGPIEIITVNDPRARDVSRIYQREIADFRAGLGAGSDREKAFDAYLENIKSQIPSLRDQGNANRNDLYSGRDEERARQARAHIDDLARIDEQNRLFTEGAAAGGYADDIARTERRDRMERARQSRDMYNQYGINPMAPGARDRLRAAQQEAAIGEDQEVQEQIRVRNEWQQRIGNLQTQAGRVRDAGMRAEMLRQVTELETQRDAAVNELATRQRTARTEAAPFAVEKLRQSAAREHSYDHADAREEGFREKALARRRALGLDVVPFFEKRRGAIMESYFRDPRNPNMVVLERYDRRSGAMLSQNVFTTENPVIDNATGNFRGSRWRREIADQVDESRDEDRQIANETVRAGRLRRARFALGLGGTRRLDGQGGAYDLYAQAQNNPRQRARVRRHSGGANLFTYWTTGGRRNKRP